MVNTRKIAALDRGASTRCGSMGTRSEGSGIGRPLYGRSLNLCTCDLAAAMSSKASPRLRPALRERQSAGAERLTLALVRERPALGLHAIDAQPSPERRDQHRAPPVPPRRRRPG